MRWRDTVSLAALAVGSAQPASYDGPQDDPAAIAAAAAAAQPVAAPAGEAAPAAPAAAAAAAPEPAPDQAGHLAQPSLIEGLAVGEAKPDGAAAAPDKPGEAPAAAPGDAAPKAGDAAPVAPAAKPAEGEAKPGAAAPEAKPDPAPKPAEAKPADAPAAPVALKLEDVKLPDGFRAEGETLPQFVTIMNDAALVPTARAQQLVDLHVKLMQDYGDRFARELAAEQHRVFGDTRQAWQKQIMADPVLGGAGHQTAMGTVARMRDFLVPAELRAPRVWDKASAEAALKGQPPEKIAALVGTKRLSAWDEFLRVTGAGDHPVFTRLLHNAGRYFDEPASPPPGARPPPNIGQRPRNARGTGSRRDILYDHPSSQRRS